ncbi:MAG: AraC family transcriptional regulator [Verrucomicrobiota bacterium]
MKYPVEHAWNQHFDELNRRRPSPQLTVGLVRIEGPVTGNYVHVKHVHPYWQIEWVVGQEFSIQIGRKTLHLRDGDIVLIPPQNWHHLEHPEGKSGRSIKFVVEEMAEHYPPGIMARSPASALIHRALGAAIALGNEPEDDVRVHIEHLISALLDIHYARLNPTGAESDLVREARKLIERAVAAGRPIKVNELAAELRCSTAYLNRVFRVHLGIPAKVFIDQHRFEIARRLLLETNLTITELADSLGFDDAFRFSRFFKRLSGESPSDFRKLHPAEEKV